MPASYALDNYITMMKPTLTAQIYSEWLMQIHLHVVHKTPYIRTVIFDKNAVVSKQGTAQFS